jgi:hypothetical protein
MTSVDVHTKKAIFSIIDHEFIAYVVNDSENISEDELQLRILHIPIISKKIESGHVALKICSDEPDEADALNSPNSWKEYSTLPTCGTKL